MKFTTNQQDLAPILVHLSRVTTNILSNVELTVGNDSMTLHTTNIDLHVIGKIPAKVEQTGSAYFNCKELSAIISHLNGDITFTMDSRPEEEILADKSETPVVGWLTIKTKNQKFKIASYKVMLPKEPTLNETPITVDAKELIQQLKRTLPATQQGINNLLSGVLLDGQNVVATDGNMMIVNHLQQGLFDEQVILPSKLVDEMTKCFANDSALQIATNGRSIVISSDTMTITSTLLEGQYPKYAQLIPQSYTKKAVLNAKELLQQVGLIELAANQRTNICKLAITPTTLTLSANKDGCEGDTCMDIESTDSLDIAFNIGYLLKILKNYDSDVIEFSFDSSLKAGLFKPNADDVCLLMPVATRG